jgi:hypothetical protein
MSHVIGLYMRTMKRVSNIYRYDLINNKLKITHRWNYSLYCSQGQFSTCNFIFYIRYINYVLSDNNNNQFHTYVYSIYPNELEIKDTTECSTFASYLNILKLDTNGNLTTLLYGKRDDLNFSIVNFPYLCSNYPISPPYDVYISHLIRYTRACLTYDQFLINLQTNKLISQGFLQCRLQAVFREFYGRYSDLLYHYNLPLGEMLSDVFHTNR